MSDTTSKRERDDDSQGLDVETGDEGPDTEAGDEEDDALDAALFGEDDEDAEPADENATALQGVSVNLHGSLPRPFTDR